jgi:hypothetical protein
VLETLLSLTLDRELESELTDETTTSLLEDADELDGDDLPSPPHPTNTPLEIAKYKQRPTFE